MLLNNRKQISKIFVWTFQSTIIFRSSNLQNATREEKMWFAWDSTRLVGEAAREAFCLIDL